MASEATTTRPTERDGEYCAFCDLPVRAAWEGQRVIGCCHTCAIEVLPTLMADAIAPQVADDWDRVKRIFDQAESRFWRAMCHRLIKERGKDAA